MGEHEREVDAQTRTMEAVDPEPEPYHDEDEDTLEGLKAPAAVDTMVVPPEDAQLLTATAGEERPSLGRRLLVVLVIVTLVLVIAALVLWGLAR